jgi:hypothetical protein
MDGPVRIRTAPSAPPPFSESGSRLLSAMDLPPVERSSISAPTATWLYVPHEIEACAVGAPLS